MSYVHPLFDSKIEEVSPPQLARALGFKVEIDDDVDFDKYPHLERLYTAGDFDVFFECWQPSPPVGYSLGGKYETEDGPFCFWVKPDSLLSFELHHHGEFSVAAKPKEA